MDPHKKSLDPYKNDPDWILSGAVATMHLFRVMSQLRLAEAQAKLLDSQQQLVNARQRVRMKLLEHKRKE